MTVHTVSMLRRAKSSLSNGARMVGIYATAFTLLSVCHLRKKRLKCYRCHFMKSILSFLKSHINLVPVSLINKTLLPEGPRTVVIIS
ncbi:hypothetical protein DM15PD_14270 [Aristophania vespae]|nr:hypothetical protein DM15PD_14270 [Aristophania vespae]